MWRFKVLLVDDRRDIREVMRAVVESVGGEVIAEAENGEEALQKYVQCKPHMTLLDVNMPIVDGKTTLRSIKEINSRACVIMLTSDNKSEVVRQCVALGARAYVLKNNTPDMIGREIVDAWDGYVSQMSGVK